MVALAIAVIVAFSSLSVAQYYDDDDDGGYHQSNPRQARQYGYRQGYRDGYAKGRHEGRENDPNDYQSPDWPQGSPRTGKMIAAAVQWAERIMQRVDATVGQERFV
jgi:hypothetical protein